MTNRAVEFVCSIVGEYFHHKYVKHGEIFCYPNVVIRDDYVTITVTKIYDLYIYEKMIMKLKNFVNIYVVVEDGEIDEIVEKFPRMSAPFVRDNGFIGTFYCNYPSLLSDILDYDDDLTIRTSYDDYYTVKIRGVFLYSFAFVEEGITISKREGLESVNYESICKFMEYINVVE